MSMLKRLFCGALATVATMGLIGCTPESGGTKFNPADYPFYTDGESVTYSAEGYAQAMSRPYWLGNVVYNELALPLDYGGGLIFANLLYKPLKVVSVMDQTLNKVYEEGKDYVVDKERGRLTIPEGSAIPTLNSLAETGVNPPEGYELSGSPDNVTKYTIWDLGKGPFVYTESGYFYAKYLSVTYVYDPQELPKEVFAQYDWTMLTGIRDKLEAGEDIVLGLIGDSISAGSSSTGDNLHVAPYTPSYGNQLAAEIERVWKVNVELENIARGGSESIYPLTSEGNNAFTGLLAKKPDLCIIAYGMNDSTGGVSASDYGANIQDIISHVKGASADCSIVLVNSFPCNPLYERVEGVFDDYLAQLNAIGNSYADGSVAVVDMHKVGNYLTKTEGKIYSEISSSNCNHPNDFMHRIYCMSIMSVLTDYKN